MLSLGMSYNEYWHGEATAAKYYYEAEKMRQERVNNEAWLYGIYTLSALQATIGNMFKKQSDSPIEYPKEPIGFKMSESEKEKSDQLREEQEVAFAKLYMDNLLRVGKDWGKNRKDTKAPTV